MKRTLSLVLALVMVLGTFTGVFAAEATITPAEFLAEKGVLQGADGDLMLDKNLERRDAVVLLSRLLGVESEAKTFLTTEESPSWEDARTDAYYVPFFAWAEENGYFAGDDEGNFNPRNPITAQEYALVLARALEYDLNGHEPWAAALAIAEELGLLEGVEVEDKDEVVRGDMAVMTYNTLNAKVNGSDQTLAEKLGIEMPAEPKPENLEAEVYTENLKEIIVELNDASLVDEEDLLDTANYKIIRNIVERVSLDENKVIVELRTELDLKQSYELIIGGIDKDINGRYDFTAQDDVAPMVESVEVLGEYGIKVTTSEPIKSYQERNFLVDGKNVAMNVENYGRVLILTPYYSTSFPENAEELEVRGLEDYAKFKSSVQTFDIEVVKDEVAPEVTRVEIVADNVIEVTFDKDIYEPSVTGYDSRRVLGNVSYGQGRHTVYSKQSTTTTNYGDKTDLNKAVYTFDERLPRNVEITVEGVQNHSKVEMEAVTERAVERIDYRQPVILDVDFWKTGSDAVPVANFDLYFDKDVFFDLDKNEVEDYLTVYNGTVATRNIVDEAVITFDYAEEDEYNIINVTVTGLKTNSRANNFEYDYVLEIKDFEDASMLRNRMHVDYYDFELKPGATAFNVTNIDVVRDTVETEVRIYFSKPVNRTIAEDKTNYIFLDSAANPGRRDVADLKGDIIVENDGRLVTLVIPTKTYDARCKTLRILDTLKDKDGVRLSAQITHVLAEAFAPVVTKAVALEAEAANYDVEEVNNALAVLVALKGSDNYKSADSIKLENAVNKLQDAIDAVKADLNEDLEAAKDEVKELIAKGKDLHEALSNKTDASSTALLVGLNNAERDLNNAKTAAEVEAVETALEPLIGAAADAELTYHESVVNAVYTNALADSEITEEEIAQVELAEEAVGTYGEFASEAIVTRIEEIIARIEAIIEAEEE